MSKRPPRTQTDADPDGTDEAALKRIGEVAHLRVVGLSPFGAFLDWGLSKDLLVPFKEQRVPMKKGRTYSVYIYRDVTGRVAASSRLHRHLDEIDKRGVFEVHQPVELHVASRSDLGYSAVINGTHLGLIHNSDILQRPKLGDNISGYIKTIREDGRIDLSLTDLAPGRRGEQREALGERILKHLEEKGGSSPLTDKSPPEAIYQTYGVSKSNYKKALGKLYKEKRIVIDKEHIRLV
jgi:uncharacterized protein